MNRRNSARAILLDELDRVLLLEYEDDTPVDPALPELLRYWLTPGGGLENDESYADALRRELGEELGLTTVDIGGLVGERNITLDLPGRGVVTSHEEYYLCRVTGPVTINHDGFSPTEKKVFRNVRWWTLDDLSGSGPVLRPPALVELVRAAIRGGGEVLHLDG